MSDLNFGNVNYSDKPSRMIAEFKGVPFEYFNIERKPYYHKLIPVVDICDVGVDFIHIDDVDEAYTNNSNFNLAEHYICDEDSLYFMDMDTIRSIIKTYILEYTGRKKWHLASEFLDLDEFPKCKWGRQIPLIHNADIGEYTLECRYNTARNGDECYICKNSDIKPKKYEEGYVPPKRKVYKCEMTRMELRDAWTFVVYLLNNALQGYTAIPLKVTARNAENLPEIVKLVKKLGVTEDQFNKFDYTNQKVYIKMFRNPTKYRWEPVKKKR